MPVLTLALKDLRLLLRDPRAAVILFVMPVVLIHILDLSFGTAFGQKPDDRLRISVVVLDQGLPPDTGPFPGRPWSQMVLDDLADTANIRIEKIDTREDAERLVRRGDRAAVVVFEPEFSDRVHRCSFVGADFQKDPINPLYRDGMRTKEIGVTLLRDPTQPVAAGVIEQVVQVTLVRVVIPWMIGKAIELIGTDPFMDRMGKHIPGIEAAFVVIGKRKLGEGIQKGIEAFFDQFRFKAKTWAGLTNSRPPPKREENRTAYESDDVGLFAVKPGDARRQYLVPAGIVTFQFLLVLVVGWLFAAERRHGTLVRLRAAPLARWQILLGKLIPCLLVSLLQAAFLVGYGKLLLGLDLGPRPDLLVPLVVCTSLAAVGLAVLVAAVARTEAQVSVFGTMLVLVLTGVSGALMPRELVPESMRRVARATPQAWALDGYLQVLANPVPEAAAVWTACGALAAFAAGFLALAWWRLDLD
jgi:ABC-type transport system involved in cytochrome c biogenesis permease component